MEGQCCPSTWSSTWCIQESSPGHVVLGCTLPAFWTLPPCHGTHALFAGHPQLSTHLPVSLPACRHGQSAHCVLFHTQDLHRAPPLPSSHVLVHKPTAHTQGPFRESRGNYVTCLQAHSGSSSHKFPGSQSLFLSCPQATLLNISWDESFYHL